jgi:ABC-type uncharacterized transport system permease subunit
MSLSIILLSLLIVAYFLAFILYSRAFFGSGREMARWAGHLMEFGFLLHTIWIFAQMFSVLPMASTEFHLPVTNVGEASGFFAWSLAFIYLALLRRAPIEAFGLILIPALILFLIPSFFSFPVSEKLLTYFGDTYFLVHILTAFFGYACFALSFIAASFYLFLDQALKRKFAGPIYRELPPLEELERFIFRTIFWGLLLLGGAIVTGALWSKSEFNSFFLKEPKSLASLLTWAVYLAIMYSHTVLAIKGRRIVRMSLLAFVLVLFTFLGTGLFQNGLHVGVS